jgi:hypothetical protein
VIERFDDRDFRSRSFQGVVDRCETLNRMADAGTLSRQRSLTPRNHAVMARNCSGRPLQHFQRSNQNVVSIGQAKKVRKSLLAQLRNPLKVTLDPFRVKGSLRPDSREDETGKKVEILSSLGRFRSHGFAMVGSCLGRVLKEAPCFDVLEAWPVG